MRINNGSVCIVASTLPAGFMQSQIEALKLKKIIVMGGQSLDKSYQSFKSNDPTIKIIKAPLGFVSQAIFFLIELVLAVRSNHSVVFFHECCAPVLDLIINLLRPKGYFLPQVTMSGWQEINYQDYPKSKLTYFFKMFGLVNKFKYYRCSAVGDDDDEYAVSVRNYPSSILVKEVQYSRKLIYANHRVNKKKSNKILLITGKSFVSNQSQKDMFLRFIDLAISNGYSVYIKDHPNPMYRLNLIVNNVSIIEPELPIELLDNDYEFVVGVSSTALLAFNDRAISLVDLFDDITVADRDNVKKHFNEACSGNVIKFIKSIHEFKELF